jgi:hypothetical protein
MTTPGQQYGGPGDPGASDGPTRPVNVPGGYPQHGPAGAQYGPPAGGGFPPTAQYPPPGQGGWPPPGQPGQPGGWPPPPGPDQFGPFQPPPGRPQGGPKAGLVIGILVAAIVLVGGGGAAWYFLAGPGSGDDRAPTAAGPSPSAPPPSAAPPTSGPVGIPPGADSGGDVSVDVEVGECITLGGTITDATAEPAACGSQEANYKVIAKTETSAECPTDADQSFYETLGGSEVGALCLDIDWAQGDCFELSGTDPVRISCTAPGPQTVRVAETIQGTDDIAECAEGGFPYPERRFVVCAEEV